MKNSGTITAIIETPKGSGYKYNYDFVSGYFKLSKVMPAGLVFPFDFGYIPETIGEDGDPVDVLVISEWQTFMGCAVDCRIIGGIKASQQERDGERMRNDRIIAVPIVSVQYAAVKSMRDLPKGMIDELEKFFKNYNDQAGKSFIPLERLTPLQASSIVAAAADLAIKDSLVRMFIPLKDNQGAPFPEGYYQNLNKELQNQFGGVTIYIRSPVKGIWKQDDNTRYDDLLVYEVLTNMTHDDYWQGLKTKLEKLYAQEEILIQISKIRTV